MCVCARARRGRRLGNGWTDYGTTPTTHSLVLRALSISSMLLTAIIRCRCNEVNAFMGSIRFGGVTSVASSYYNHLVVLSQWSSCMPVCLSVCVSVWMSVCVSVCVCIYPADRSIASILGCANSRQNPSPSGNMFGRGNRPALCMTTTQLFGNRVSTICPSINNYFRLADWHFGHLLQLQFRPSQGNWPLA